ncbi:MAG: NUDIX domain-containing protein [Acidimicrobiales bacterium]
MPKTSAGLLLYRRTGAADAAGEPRLEVLAVHPGGPFWTKRDEGAWSIPKGEYVEGEDPLTVARREFAEELGRPVPAGEPVPLGEVRQSGGKRVTAWAVALADDAVFEVDEIASNTFEMEWPPRSGVMREFPEVDRAEWFDVATARIKLVPAQTGFLDELLRYERG